MESIDQVPEGSEPQITPEELIMCEVIVRNDPKVQALAKQVGKRPSNPLFFDKLTAHAGVEPHQIFADGWAIGYDDRFPKHQRLQQAFLFARFSEHDNLYAHPLVNLCPFSYFLHAIFDFECILGFYSSRGLGCRQGRTD